jgi:hypothetical protein
MWPYRGYMYDDENSFFRRPEIIGVLGASIVIFLGVILFVLFHAPGPAAPTNASATSPTTTTFTTKATNAGSNTFGVNYNANQYTCWDNASLAEDFFYDCSLGGIAKTGNVTLYCNGDAANPSCSTDWYPSKLQGYDLRTINGAHYLCSTATSSVASTGDKLCAKYAGGDPTKASTTNGLKCSTSGASVTCNANYFPSELNDLTIIKAEGQQYVCVDTGDGANCYRWDGTGSPKQATQGEPDLYCDKNNDCAAA